MIAEYLSAQGYSVDSVYDGASGLARAYERAYDIIILDVMLPRLDGFEVLRSLRRRSEVPVILLTARASEADRLQGFEVGADDYLPKPFAAGELLARLRAVLRRAQGTKPPSAELHVGPIVLNPASRRASNEGVELELDLDGIRCPRVADASGRPDCVPRRDRGLPSISARHYPSSGRSTCTSATCARSWRHTASRFCATVRGVGYQLSTQK